MTRKERAEFSLEASEVIAVKARTATKAGRGLDIRSLALTE